MFETCAKNKQGESSILLERTTSRDDAVVDVNVRGHTFHLHTFHQLKGDIWSTTLLHATCGSTKNDNVLLNTNFGHFIQEFKTLPILEAWLIRKEKER